MMRRKNESKPSRLTDAEGFVKDKPFFKERVRKASSGLLDHLGERRNGGDISVCE